jgi:GH15 family glucan-1,4-alpha-glucosidase
MYKSISEHGIVGNLRTVGLIADNGCLDWLCLPYIDSPSVFGSLLDDDRGGLFVVQPNDDYDSVSEYLPRTNILITRFRTRTGIMKLTDFMPVEADEITDDKETHYTLYRLIEVEEGWMDVHVRFRPRFDYARARTTVTKIEHGVKAEGGGRSIGLVATKGLQVEDVAAEALWNLEAGDTVCLRLGATGEETVCADQDCRMPEWDAALAALEETANYWRSWLDKDETGRAIRYGRHKEQLERSALVLKLLFYGPSGAIAAAATTSLPETVGGVRNWDYRFTWIRDASFTLQALFNLGHLSETEAYLRWIESLLKQSGGAAAMQIMYGLRGERDLEEIELSHLDGHKGSRPVRVGNGAARQKQMDIYGELMDAALKLSNYVGKITSEQWPLLREMCDYVCDNWTSEDSGIWEVRGGPRHFVYSKVMCWTALDRGVTIADQYGFPADRDRWRSVMEEIKREVLEQGFDSDKQSFVQHYGSNALDSSNLLIPVLGFLPFDDSKVVSTIEAVKRELSHDGLLYRYRCEDGLEGKEGTFLVCTFWLVDCLTHLGRLDEAEELIVRLERTANHLGLFSEEYDAHWNEALGNFPQAFTHIGYVNAVTNLVSAKEKAVRRERPAESRESRGLMELIRKRIVWTRQTLNEGSPETVLEQDEIVPTLKKMMNLMRGAFLDSRKGRVAYERMKEAEVYREYVDISRNLQHLDLTKLGTREGQIAFWINLYNVIVIHGVIELNVKNSVTEVRRFFRRVRYRIGGMSLTPDDIEHGILRGNRRPPSALFRVFRKGDPRLDYRIDPIDPRIHFALVCASSSCPPIELYTGDDLDKQLDLAGRTFLNGGGLVLDKDRRLVRLSRIFQWYGSDFADTDEERLQMLAKYVYHPVDQRYLENNAGALRIEYQDYDWRLNRGTE